MPLLFYKQILVFENAADIFCGIKQLENASIILLENKIIHRFYTY